MESRSSCRRRKNPKERVRSRNDDTILDDIHTNDIAGNKASIHRRPVKKRRIESVKALSKATATATTTTTTTTTTGLPDLVQEVYVTTGTTATVAADPSTSSVGRVDDAPHSKDDSDDKIATNLVDNNFDMVPSPPPLMRSVAQLIQYNVCNNNNNTDHEPPPTRPPFVTTTEYGNTNDTVGTYSPSKAAMTPRHRRTMASFSYDLPPIHDMVASLSLSSLPKKGSVASDASFSNHKNHNKILPKYSSSQNSMCLSTDQDNEDECSYVAYNDLTAAAVVPPPTSTMHHLNQSEQPDLFTTNPMIPPAFMSGKVISTKYGLAMVVVPSSDITISDYTNTFASSTAMHAFTNTNNNNASSQPPLMFAPNTCMMYTAHATTTMPTTTTRFKHWLKSEDELLQYAITKQMNGPPYMWQQIAQTYFPNTRNANQVRNNKVSDCPYFCCVTC